MWAVSDRFLRSLRRPHTIAVRAQVLMHGVVVEGLNDLAVASGSVTMDRTATVQRTGNLTLVHPIDLPVDSTSRLAPFGAEIRVWRGVRWADGTEELVPLCTGPIQDSDANIGTRVTGLQFEDRSRLVIDAAFEAAYQIAAGSDPATAWADLISSRVQVPISAMSTAGFVTPLLTWAAKDDPWAAAKQVAESVGAVAEFDGLGNCVLRSQTLPSLASQWDVNSGDDGVLIDGSVSMSRRDSANRVIGAGGNSSTGGVWQSIATDDDPGSPMPYQDGPKPVFVDFPAAGSQQATDVATAAELERVRGVARRITVRSVPNPALLLSDAVRVHHPDVGLDEVDAIDRIVIELGDSGTQQIDTRTVQAA